MTALKQTISQLPDWFEIRNYASAAEFTIEDWHWNILHRLQLKSWIRSGTNDRATQDWDFHESWLRAILANPCLKSRSGNFPTTGLIDLVRDMSVRDVMGYANELHHDDVYAAAWNAHQVALDATDDELRKDALRLSDNLDDSVNDFVAKRWPTGSGNLAYLEVNVNAPIADLSASFLAWIKQAKAKQNNGFAEKKSFTESDFKKWHRYCLLPYFDLTLWAEFEQVNIPVWLYVKGLFSDRGGDVDGAFRKDTRPHADKVFTYECLEHLANQVSPAL